MRILFWNTHRNVDINSYILDIVNQNEIDVLVLAEYMAEINELNDNLKQCKKRLFNWNTKGCERIHIWGNYIDVTPGEQNKYFSVQIVNKQYIMCGVHMYSNLNGEHYDERVALAEEIMYSIKHIKQRLQTEHVIVIGDINESPYEKACLSAKGFHALPALQILDKGSRTVYGKEYEKMYNPMWNLFGDFKYPPGTYYRVESKLYNPCWFMLDQVIISQSMIPLMVKEQLKIASGKKLDLIQDDICISGNAIECRINAEDTDNNFRPSPGLIKELYIPSGPGVRVDSAIYSGYEIPPYYDSMIGKMITYGATRDEAIIKMKRALGEFAIGGVKTNIDFQYSILNNRDFVKGNYDTSFIAEKLVRNNA